MVTILQRIKQTIFGVARASGAFAAVAASSWRARRLLILCYHGVAIQDEHEWNGNLYVTQGRLRSRLQLLKERGFQLVGLDEGVQRLAAGTLPPRAVALTFDDGAYDFLVRALPVLEEFGAPATVYVPTFYTRFQRPVFDTMVSYLAWRGREARRCVLADTIVSADPLDVGTAAERHATVNRLQTAARDAGLDAIAKDDLARRFAGMLGIDYDSLLHARVLQLMTADELAGLPRELIDVQLHTHRHRVPLDAKLFQREIRDNRRELQAILGTDRSFRHFCYPSGLHHSTFLPWLREEGVVSATTCDPGLASSDTDPLLLPRFIDTMGQTDVAFEAWASGFAEFVPRRGRSAPVEEGN